MQKLTTRGYATAEAIGRHEEFDTNGVVTKAIDGQEYRFAWNKFGAWLVRDDRSAAEPTARFSARHIDTDSVFGCEDGDEEIVETTFAVNGKEYQSMWLYFSENVFGRGVSSLSGDVTPSAKKQLVAEFASVYAEFPPLTRAEQLASLTRQCVSTVLSRLPRPHQVVFRAAPSTLKLTPAEDAAIQREVLHAVRDAVNLQLVELAAEQPQPVATLREGGVA